MGRILIAFRNACKQQGPGNHDDACYLQGCGYGAFETVRSFCSEIIADDRAQSLDDSISRHVDKALHFKVQAEYGNVHGCICHLTEYSVEDTDQERGHGRHKCRRKGYLVYRTDHGFTDRESSKSESQPIL